MTAPDTIDVFDLARVEIVTPATVGTDEVVWLAAQLGLSTDQAPWPDGQGFALLIGHLCGRDGQRRRTYFTDDVPYAQMIATAVAAARDRQAITLPSDVAASKCPLHRTGWPTDWGFPA